MATESGELNPELQKYADEFEEARTKVHELVAGLTDEEFNWRPSEDRWSVAECLDHLCMIGTLMIPKIDEGTRIGEKNGWHGDGPFRYGRIGNWFVRAVSGGEGAPKRRFKAPPMYTPKSQHSISRLKQAFVELQDQFIERVQKANGLDLARIKVPSPVTRLLRFSLGQWFALLAGHQRRHFWQAHEVLKELKAKDAVGT